MKNLIVNVMVNGKKSFDKAMNSNVKKVYESMESILDKFPEIYEKGYCVLTLGEFAKRNNVPEWRILDLKKNNEYYKKGCFKLSCIELGTNPFTGEKVFTVPKLQYIF